jgi:hypothetical protein
MENTVSTDESSTCAPMIGIMTAWVEKTTGAGLVKSDIYKIIEKYISVYATDEGVLSMTYIGTRPEVILSDAELAFLNEPTAMEPGALAGIAVASVLALLATLALIAMKRIYKPKKSKKISSSPTNGALVMGGDDDKDNDVLEIVFDDDSTNSAHTECCTVAETVGSSGKQESFGSSPCGGEPLKDEGYELSYDQVISMRENSHP